MSALASDVRYAIRSLWRSRGFAIVAILCLGVGIGVNTTIFSILDGVLLKPLPYADPERLVSFGLIREHTGDDPTLSYRDLRVWRDANTVFAGIGAMQWRSATLVDGIGEPARYNGAAVSADLFPVLGIAPAIGRPFTAEEDGPSGGAAVLLSDNVWRSRYASDPAVLGRVVTVNARPRVIVGVMPPGFQFPANQQLWIPLGPEGAADPGNSGLVFGRLKPGVTLERARQEAAATAPRVLDARPNRSQGLTGAVRTLREIFIPPDVTLILGMMMAGAALVLVIACSNVANLLLARATARQRELAVRASLGAGRRRIVRQLLTESVVLFLLSVPLGLALAQIGTRLIASALPVDEVPYFIRWAVDWRSLAYTLAIAVATAVVFGLVPALQASRGNLHESLKEGTRGNSGSRSRLRNALVVAQIALALVALAAALLFVRSFRNLDGLQIGFDPRPLLTLRVYLSGEAYEPADAKARRVHDILERIEALPGVEAAFASNMVPLAGGGGGGRVMIEGRPVDPERQPSIAFTGVTPHFLQTLGVGMRRGRNFMAHEGAPGVRTPAAVINQTMAAQFWPEGDALGRRFRLVDDASIRASDDAPEWFTVIGVAPDIRQYSVSPGDQESSPAAYVPYAYQQTPSTGFTIRVAGNPASIASAVRAQIRASDPNLPIAFVQTMEDLRRLGFWEFALFGWIFGTIGVVGLALASIGVYGVMSYSVSQRTQEIGVRMALGAGQRDVLALVVRQGLMLAGLGIAAGLVLGPAATSVGRSQFYAVSPFDPFSFGLVAVLLLAVALLASYLPARRAMRVDPVVALRGD
jgi:predicted permease